MQLEFVYKNKDASGTAIKYEIAEGANISMSYNEDLSNGTLLIRESTQIDIEPYDEIIVYGLDYVDKLYMLVESYICKETRNKYDDKEYTYEIAIMSQTKLLENKILPSLAITPKTNGNKTIKWYLELYNNLYGQKVRTESGFANKFSFDVGTKFDDVCPELQFNNPTFRECLTQLMMVKNCIPIVQNNVISYIDLSSKNDLVDKDDPYIAYVETAQSSEDYVSTIKMGVKNAIQNFGTTNCGECLGIRNKNGSVIDSNNMFLYTQYPIYEIIGVQMMWWGRTGEMLQRKDITDFVKELGEHQLMPIADTLTGVDPEDYKNYQNTTMFYTRGSNIIQNLSFVSKFGFMIATYKSLVEVYEREFFGAYLFESDWDLWRNCSFYVRYKTKADLVNNTGKKYNQTTEREVVDNQSDNYINVQTLGLLEYSKANRLGNKMKTYSARFPRNYSELPVVGDYYEGNEIVYKIDYQLWQDAVDATIYTCPNYVLRNYFTSVQSKLRSWHIVDGSEALTREESYKYYLEFSYNEHLEKTFEITLNTENFIKTCLSSLSDSNMLLGSIIIGTSPAKTTERFRFETVNNPNGFSWLYSFGYNDNYEVGRYTVKPEWYETLGGDLQYLYSYTDNDGNFTKLHIEVPKDYYVNVDVSYDGYKAVIREEPKVFENGYKGLFVRYIKYFDLVIDNYYKDNKEIPRFNLQFEYCVDSEDIILSEDIKTAGEYANLLIKVNDTDIKPMSDLTITNAANGTSAKITISGVSSTDRVKIYNKNSLTTLLEFTGDTIYMNLLKQRNKNVYEKDGNDWKIKTSI